MLQVLAHSVLENEFGAHSFGGGPLCLLRPFLRSRHMPPVCKLNRLWQVTFGERVRPETDLKRHHFFQLAIR